MCSESDINREHVLFFIADLEIEHGIHLGSHLGFFLFWRGKLSVKERDMISSNFLLFFTLFFRPDFLKAHERRCPPDQEWSGSTRAAENYRARANVIYMSDPLSVGVKNVKSEACHFIFLWISGVFGNTTE